MTQMQIKRKVDETNIGNIKNGQKVTFRIDAFPDEEIAGKVSQVRIVPETERASNILRIPVAYLRFMPSKELLETASIDRRIVWTESKGKLNRAVDVVIGILDNRCTHLVKGNISEDDKLIINAQIIK